jgi:hypothetical protein
MKSRVLLMVLVSLSGARLAEAQRGIGELRLQVRDATGGAVQASGSIESQTTHVRQTFTTDATGSYIATDLPFGPYYLQIESADFSVFSSVVDVRSEIPQSYPVTLAVAPVQTSMTVTGGSTETLLDPHRAGSAQYISGDLLRDRPSAAPGRSIIDLVNTQPGWLLEANGLLEPRGSEYQVQYVIDGMPVRDNRSPAFAQSLGIEEFESMTIRTAGYPPEFGGKLGGIIEVNTIREAREGFHGTFDAQAGSFSALSGDFVGTYVKGGTAVGFSVEGMRTDRYLDPPVEANYTNHGSGGGIAGHVEQNWNASGRTRAYLDHHSTTFQVPNELLQEQVAQRQERTADETLAQISHNQVFTANVLGTFGFMYRDNRAALTANALSTPIIPSQDRGFREGYVNGNMSIHQGRHEFKVGGEAIFSSIDEAFSSTIVAYRLNGISIFDRDLPQHFDFSANRPGREQALFAQDQIRLGPVTVLGGLRYDHYSLMVDEHAVSPRLAGSWNLGPAGLVLHASYDRAFQTPSIENVILANSDLVKSLGGEGLSLTLRSSRGNFYEAGFSKSLVGRFRVDGNYFYRKADNFADDDLLLNTAVSFPIAFSEGTVKGFEAKLDVPHWDRFSGWFSYSNLKAVGQLPIAGGLFLGDEAGALLNSTDTFPISQDQRHTVRGRIRYELTPRAWVAIAAQYNSGLPVEVEGNPNEAVLVQQYGQSVVDQVDFDRRRVRPSSSIDLSAGAVLWNRQRNAVRLQFDVFNIADRLNVINFAGLLSGTAVAPRRTLALRLRTDF